MGASSLLQVCPVCAMRVGVDMVAHITLQHGNIFKISFSSDLLGSCFGYLSIIISLFIAN